MNYEPVYLPCYRFFRILCISTPARLSTLSRPHFSSEIAQLCPIFDLSFFSFFRKVGNLPIKILEIYNSFPKREDGRRKSG